MAVSVDVREGTTTGISASDRAKTVCASADYLAHCSCIPNAHPSSGSSMLLCSTLSNGARPDTAQCGDLLMAHGQTCVGAGSGGSRRATRAVPAARPHRASAVPPGEPCFPCPPPLPPAVRSLLAHTKAGAVSRDCMECIPTCKSLNLRKTISLAVGHSSRAPR